MTSTFLIVLKIENQNLHKVGSSNRKLVVVSGRTVVVVGKRSSFRKLTGCMISPSWKVYSIVPSIWFEVLLQDKEMILFKDFNPY